MGDPSGHPAEAWGWTSAQQRALIVLLAIFLAALCVRFATSGQFVSDPQPVQGSRSSELASRIDPNTADWQTLAAIPTLGEKRAKEIVACRQRALRVDPHAVVFKSAEDLSQVRGIGPATVENLRPYLQFPAASSRSAP